jgi:hypothetical protein
MLKALAENAPSSSARIAVNPLLNALSGFITSAVEAVAPHTRSATWTHTGTHIRNSTPLVPIARIFPSRRVQRISMSE